jgi:hypothetical protein
MISESETTCRRHRREGIARRTSDLATARELRELASEIRQMSGEADGRPADRARDDFDTDPGRSDLRRGAPGASAARCFRHRKVPAARPAAIGQMLSRNPQGRMRVPGANNKLEEEAMGIGKGALLWLLGIPLPIILLLALFWR